jgi:hypothetical protein
MFLCDVLCLHNTSTCALAHHHRQPDLLALHCIAC